MTFSRTRTIFRFSLVAAGLNAGVAFAEDAEPGYPFPVGPVEMRATFDAGAGAMTMPNAQFGNGSNSRTGTRAGGRTWYEGFVKPGVEFKFDTDGTGELYGRASAIGAATRGQGDSQATSTTSDQPEHFSLEEAYAGWRMGPVDLSVGNQNFMVGDGFLIANGTLDGGGRGAYLLGPRAVFEKTAIARLDWEPVRVDVFHLSGSVDQTLMYGADNPDTRLYGANVEWFEPTEAGKGGRTYDQRKWYVGLTALKVYDADNAFSFRGSQGGTGAGANRDGLAAYSVRFGGSFIPTFDDFAMYGEWAVERNDDRSTGGTVRADAWHLQPQYKFSDLPWSPVVTARYAHFSGDDNTGYRRDKSWDPLFSDAGPRSGSWVQGLIYGNFVGSNSNLNAKYAAIEAAPIEDELKVGLAYYRFDFDKLAQAGAGSHHLMDEVNLYATWTTPVPGLTVSPGLGAGMAGSGQRQVLGLSNSADRTIWLGQVVLAYQF